MRREWVARRTLTVPDADRTLTVALALALALALPLPPPHLRSYIRPGPSPCTPAKKGGARPSPVQAQRQQSRDLLEEGDEHHLIVEGQRFLAVPENIEHR